MLKAIFALGFTIGVISILGLFNNGFWYNLLSVVSLLFVIVVYSFYSLKQALSMILSYFLIIGVLININIKDLI